MGDFNAILNNWGKVGRRDTGWLSMRDFQEFVSKAGLLDLGYAGVAYTWTNK